MFSFDFPSGLHKRHLQRVLQRLELLVETGRFINKSERKIRSHGPGNIVLTGRAGALCQLMDSADLFFCVVRQSSKSTFQQSGVVGRR